MSLGGNHPDATGRVGDVRSDAASTSARGSSSVGVGSSSQSAAPTRIARGTTPPATAANPFVPRMRLTTETLFVDDGSRRGDELTVAAIRLDFDYQGATVRANDPLPRIYDASQMARGPITRDVSGERQARRLLESLGAIELESLDDCAVSPDAQVDYVVRLDGDVHALCAFTAYAVPQLTARGWLVEIDPAYPWQVVDAAAPLFAGVTPDDKRPDWFGLELGIELDGHRVNLLPALLEILDMTDDLEALTRTTRRCVAVQVGDRHWLPIPPERLKLLLRVLHELYRDGIKIGIPASRVQAVAEIGAALYDGKRPMRWEGDAKIRDQGYALAMGPSAITAAKPLPSGLRADLRPYQRDGVAWLQHLREHGAGGILADDMGLGKTLQTIAHVLAEKDAGRLTKPAMVVTLTSCVGNWVREFAKFAPELRVLCLRGPDRAARMAQISDHDVIVTTYPLIVRDREALADHSFYAVILDEAHTIKNHSAQAHDAACALQTEHRLCLTGTPIENHLGELWSLMDFLMPGSLGAVDEFKTQFRTPIEQFGDKRRLEVLRERVRPYILRRTKDVVATDLPPKTELVRAVELTGAQRELYESIRVAAHADVRQHIRARGVQGSTIAILDALLKLRQVCCDPRLAHVDAARDVTGSAKLDLLMEMTTTQLAQGRRILVFSQFAKMLSLISESLLGRGIGHVTLTGSTTDRQKPIDAFEAGRADVFLISLRAGGTGLNLTSADTVIHYDPWWNPAAQAQATDRAYRIGQKKPVFAYNLIAAGSVEERMIALQAHKRRLADAILAPGAAATSTLSERDIDDLLAPLD